MHLLTQLAATAITVAVTVTADMIAPKVMIVSMVGLPTCPSPATWVR